MLKHISFFLSLSILAITNIAHAAFEVRAKVESNTVHWDNVTLYKGKKLPSAWGTPPSLQASEAWAAGTFAVKPQSSMRLIGGSGGGSQPIAIDILGVQYNTSGIKLAQSTNQGGGGTIDEVQLPIVTVTGASCVSNTRLINEGQSSPFIFFRPMFDIEESDIIKALNGQAEGIYSASVPLIIRYYYENDGIKTYRNINEVILFSFDYQPVQLDSVTVRGDGIMNPIYNTAQKKISANTSYDITANGYFNNGIVLTMPQRDYQLVNTENTSMVIPYNVQCAQCGNANLVNEGQLKQQTSAISKGAGVQTDVNFTLKFDYDIEGSSVISGDYSDTIRIMLEPGI
ncbi:hypothetical protein [Vibrio sp.]|uniref:hypothetical protein n=1 Tax=Vibrio sp. TaxID=678 RepID=UPI003F6C28BC